MYILMFSLLSSEEATRVEPTRRGRACASVLESRVWEVEIHSLVDYIDLIELLAKYRRETKLK